MLMFHIPWVWCYVPAFPLSTLLLLLMNRNAVTWCFIQKEPRKVSLPSCSPSDFSFPEVLPSSLKKIIYLLPLPTHSLPSPAQPKLTGSFQPSPFRAPDRVPPRVCMSSIPPWGPSLCSAFSSPSVICHAHAEVHSPQCQAGSRLIHSLLHEDSVPGCRLVWGRTTARWRERLVSYGMCQGDNLSGYHWQERGENGTLARAGNQRVASRPPSVTVRFALHHSGLLDSGPALLWILTQPVWWKEWKHLPLSLPRGYALSEQLPNTVSSQGAVYTQRPLANFLRSTDSWAAHFRDHTASQLLLGSPFSGVKNVY